MWYITIRTLHDWNNSVSPKPSPEIFASCLFSFSYQNWLHSHYIYLKMCEILPMFKKCKQEALNTSYRKNQDSNIKNCKNNLNQWWKESGLGVMWLFQKRGGERWTATHASYHNVIYHSLLLFVNELLTNVNSCFCLHDPSNDSIQMSCIFLQGWQFAFYIFMVVWQSRWSLETRIPF